MSSYGSARVRASALPSKQTYARQRLIAGVVLGFVAQLIVALIMGFLLVGGFGLAVRILATLVSSVVATPAVFAAGFGFMLKEETRSFGVGLLAGALASTLLLVLLYFLVV